MFLGTFSQYIFECLTKTNIMTTHKVLSTEAYQHIGYLFYAVAAADKKVEDEEIKTVKRLVKEQWVHLDDTADNFGSDAAYQIEIVFDWLNDNALSSKEYFTKFKNYYMKYPYLFDKDVKSLIIKTATAIAQSFAGKNKSELILLAKIEVLFKGS